MCLKPGTAIEASIAAAAAATKTHGGGRKNGAPAFATLCHVPSDTPEEEEGEGGGERAPLFYSPSGLTQAPHGDLSDSDLTFLSCAASFTASSTLAGESYISSSYGSIASVSLQDTAKAEVVDSHPSFNDGCGVYHAAPHRFHCYKYVRSTANAAAAVTATTTMKKVKRRRRYVRKHHRQGRGSHVGVTAPGVGDGGAVKAAEAAGAATTDVVPDAQSLSASPFHGSLAPLGVSSAHDMAVGHNREEPLCSSPHLSTSSLLYYDDVDSGVLADIYYQLEKKLFPVSMAAPPPPATATATATAAAPARGPPGPTPQQSDGTVEKDLDALFPILESPLHLRYRGGIRLSDYYSPCPHCHPAMLRQRQQSSLSCGASSMTSPTSSFASSFVAGDVSRSSSRYWDGFEEGRGKRTSSTVSIYSWCSCSECALHHDGSAPQHQRSQPLRRHGTSPTSTTTKSFYGEVNGTGVGGSAGGISARRRSRGSCAATVTIVSPDTSPPPLLSVVSAMRMTALQLSTTAATGSSGIDADGVAAVEPDVAEALSTTHLTTTEAPAATSSDGPRAPSLLATEARAESVLMLRNSSKNTTASASAASASASAAQVSWQPLPSTSSPKAMSVAASTRRAPSFTFVGPSSEHCSDDKGGTGAFAHPSLQSSILQRTNALSLATRRAARARNRQYGRLRQRHRPWEGGKEEDNRGPWGNRGVRARGGADSIFQHGLLCIRINDQLTYLDPRNATGAAKLLVDAAVLAEKRKRKQQRVEERRANREEAAEVAGGTGRAGSVAPRNAVGDGFKSPPRPRRRPRGRQHHRGGVFISYPALFPKAAGAVADSAERHHDDDDEEEDGNSMIRSISILTVQSSASHSRVAPPHHHHNHHHQLFHQLHAAEPSSARRNGGGGGGGGALGVVADSRYSLASFTAQRSPLPSQGSPVLSHMGLATAESSLSLRGPIIAVPSSHQILDGPTADTTTFLHHVEASGEGDAIAPNHTKESHAVRPSFSVDPPVELPSRRPYERKRTSITPASMQGRVIPSAHEGPGTALAPSAISPKKLTQLLSAAPAKRRHRRDVGTTHSLSPVSTELQRSGEDGGRRSAVGSLVTPRGGNSSTSWATSQNPLGSGLVSSGGHHLPRFSSHRTPSQTPRQRQRSTGSSLSEMLLNTGLSEYPSFSILYDGTTKLDRHC